MKTILSTIFLFFIVAKTALAESAIVGELPQTQSECLTKLALTNRPLIDRQKFVLRYSSKVDKTISILNLLALPALIGGLAARNNEGLRITLLSTSIGLNVSALYLRFRQPKRNKQSEDMQSNFSGATDWGLNTTGQSPTRMEVLLN